MEFARCHAIVSGEVQGVGFRAFTMQRARALQLTGWARNLSDGRVEVVAEGDRGSVLELLQMLEIGPSASEVAQVDVSWEPYLGEFGYFIVR